MAARRHDTRPPNTEKPVRKRDGPSTENKILAAAEILFSRYGFDGVSTKQLAAEAGMAIGALYHHFPSKEAVYAAVTKRAFATRAALPRKLLESNESAELRLIQLVSWFIRDILLDKTFGLLLKREMLDPRPSTANLLDENHFQQHLTLFQQLIRQIAPRANADEAVVTVLALIFGFANMKGIYTLFPDVRKTLETPEEMAEYATGVLLRALKN